VSGWRDEPGGQWLQRLIFEAFARAAEDDEPGAAVVPSNNQDEQE